MEILSFPGPGQPCGAGSRSDHQGSNCAAINAAGGVHGHPVKLIECLDHGDPNQARTCANQAVSNPNVVATIFVFSNNDNVIDPIMESAGLPQIGIDPQGTDDPKCNVCFAFDGGGLSDTAGIGTELHIYDGVNKIDMEIPSVPVAQAEMSVAKQELPRYLPHGHRQGAVRAVHRRQLRPVCRGDQGLRGHGAVHRWPQLVAWVKTGVVAAGSR